MTRRAAEAAATALGHPRHVALYALVAGLLLARAPFGLGRGGRRVLCLCGARGGCGVAGRRRRAARRSVLAGGALPGAGVALAAALALLGGAALAEQRLRVVDSGRLAAAAGARIAGPAILLEPLRHRGGGPAVARVRLASGPLAGEAAVLRVRGEALAGGDPGVGEVVEVQGRVAPLGPYDAYQRPRGAGAAIEAGAVRRTGLRRGGVAGALDAVRRRAERGLQRGLHGEDAALLRGMVLGQDERLSDAVREEFQVSGLAHLLAVSGQNVMLLAILVLAGAAALGLPLRARLGLALLLVAAYVPLAGGGPSIQRAGVMGAAGLVAALAGRPASRWYALGLAAAATLALNPLAVLEPGWQLSFAAVVALLAMAPALRELLARRVPGPVADAAAITIAATAGTAPLMALHFESLSLASLPANLAAAPAVAPIMWLGMLSAAAAQLSPALAAPLNALDGPLLAYLTSVARTAAQAPYAAVPVRLGSAAALMAAAALPVALAAAVRAAARRLPPAGLRRPGLRPRPVPVLAACACVALVAVLAWRHAHPSFRAGPGEVVVSFLDVGQGDATLVQDGGGASVLFDGGPPEAGVQNALRAAGVRRLDLVVATHQSRDHQGGLHAVLARIPTRMLLENGDGTLDPDFRRLLAEADARGIRRVAARAGQVLAVGGLVVRVLCARAAAARRTAARGPEPARRGGGRERRELRPVALGRRRERRDPRAAAAPGGGDEGLPPRQRGPGTAVRAQRLRPQVAAIEVGAGNDYGHPAPSTLAALRAVPHVYRTDRDGTVVLRVSGGRMRVETGA